MKKVNFKIQIISMIMIICIFTTGCTSIFGGNFNVEYLPPEQVQQAASQSGVGAVINYEANEDLGEGKYLSEYPDAFYIPEKYSKASEDIISFQLVDFINETTFLYLYQTRIYNITSTTSEEVLGEAGGEYTMNEPITVQTKTVSNRMVTVLAAYDYTKMSEAGYYEIFNYEAQAGDSQSAFVKPIVTSDGSIEKISGYGVFYDRFIQMYDAEKLKAFLTLPKDQRTKDQLNNTLIASYGGYNTDGTYNQESININNIINQKLRSVVGDPSKYVIDFQNATFYYIQNGSQLTYDIVIQFAASKDVNPTAEEEANIANQNYQVYDDEDSDDGTESIYFQLNLSFATLGDIYYSTYNKNYFNQDSYFETCAGKSISRTSRTSPYDNGTNGWSGVPTEASTKRSIISDFTELKLLDEDYNPVYKAITEMSNNTRISNFNINSFNYLMSTSGLKPSWVGENYNSTRQETFCITSTPNLLANQIAQKPAEALNWQLVGFVQTYSMNSFLSDVYIKYLRQNEDETTTEVIGHRWAYFTYNVIYKISQAKILHMEVTSAKEPTKEYLVNTLSAYYSNNEIYTYFDNNPTFNNYYYLRIFRPSFSVLLQQDLLDSETIDEAITDVRVRIINEDAYIYVSTQNYLKVFKYNPPRYSYDYPSLSLVFSGDMRDYNITASNIANASPSNLEGVSISGNSSWWTESDLYEQFDGNISNLVNENDIAAGISIVSCYDASGMQIDTLTCIFGGDNIYIYDESGTLLVSDLSYEKMIQLLQGNASVAETLSNNQILVDAWTKPTTNEWTNLADIVKANLHWEYEIFFAKNASGTDIISISKNSVPVGEFEYQGQITSAMNTYGIDAMTWDSMTKYMLAILNPQTQSTKEYHVNESPVETYECWNMSLMNGNFLGRGNADYWVSATAQNGISIKYDSGIYVPVFQKNEIVVSMNTIKTETVSGDEVITTTTKETVYSQQLMHLNNGVKCYGIFKNSYNVVDNRGIHYDYFFLGYDNQNAVYTRQDFAQAKVIPFAIVDDSNLFKNYNWISDPSGNITCVYNTNDRNFDLVPDAGENVIYLLQDYHNYTQYPGLLRYPGYRPDEPAAAVGEMDIEDFL